MQTYIAFRGAILLRAFFIMAAMFCTRSTALFLARFYHIAHYALGAFPGLLAERPFFIAGKYVGSALGVGIFSRGQHLIGIYP